MPRKGKGVRFGGDSEEEEEEKKDLRDAELYAWLNRKDTSTEEKKQAEIEARKQKEIEVIKLIEESKNLDVDRLEKLAQINAVLADFLDSEEWWNAIRQFLEDACSSKNTKVVKIILKREKNDHWVLDAEVG